MNRLDARPLEAENIKVLLRASITKTPLEEVMERLVPLPGQTSAVVESLVKAGSLTDFVTLLPFGPLRKGLENAIRDYTEDARPFFLEAALDSGYLSELLGRFALLFRQRSGTRRKQSYARRRTSCHLVLVPAGKIHYGLTGTSCCPFSPRTRYPVPPSPPAQ